MNALNSLGSAGIFVSRLTIALCLLLCGQVAEAHRFELGEARLSIEGHTFEIAVSADLIEAFERHLGLNGNDRALIERVRSLDQETITTALEEMRQAIHDDMRIRFDGEVAPIRALSFPSPRETRERVDKAPETTEYRLVLAVYGDVPSNAGAVDVRMSSILGDVRLEVILPTTTLLQAGRTSQTLSLQGIQGTGLSDVVAEFLYFTWQGIIHIVPRGLDHILFVLCLSLYARTFPDLLWQVTTFTVAHSVTLTRGWLGYVDIPAAVFEPMIAASIVYVALENIWREKPNHARLTVIFLFGLLHGLAFASVLRELSPVQGQWLARSIGFNIGLEVGQLFVVVAAFMALGLWQNRPWFRQRVVVPVSAAIAATSAFWTVERVIGALST